MRPWKKYQLTRGARVSVVAVATLILTACAGETRISNPVTSAPASAVTTAIATSTTAGPLTGDELVWLEGMSALHKTMDKIVQDAPTALTSAVMHTLAQQLASCTAALDRLGSPSDRLRPVYDLGEQGCAQYEKAAQCFATAASLGVVIGGSADDKKQAAAIHCGFATPGDGSKLFADAEGKGFEIKDAAH
jgi:hypothetical protein